MGIGWAVNHSPLESTFANSKERGSKSFHSLLVCKKCCKTDVLGVAGWDMDPLTSRPLTPSLEKGNAREIAPDSVQVVLEVRIEALYGRPRTGITGEAAGQNEVQWQSLRGWGLGLEEQSEQTISKAMRELKTRISEHQSRTEVC